MRLRFSRNGEHQVLQGNGEQTILPLSHGAPGNYRINFRILRICNGYRKNLNIPENHGMFGKNP